MVDPQGCGKLGEFGSVKWYSRDTLKFAWDEKQQNRCVCGSLSYCAIKLCKECAVKAGAEW